MRTPLRATALAAALLGLTAMPAVAGPAPGDSLILADTNGAYARFAASLDDCHSVELFVAYVETDFLMSPIGSGRPRFHSDVEAFVTVTSNPDAEACGEGTLQVYGVRGLDAADAPESTSLESASLPEFAMALDGIENDQPVTVEVTLDLSWAADGGITAQTANEQGHHAASRTVGAVVSASVLIDSVTGGGELAAAVAALAGGSIGGLEQTEGFLARYQEIFISVP